MPEISVIVPVYNAAPYIAACVDSILKQTFRDFEIILVDDGSSDKSLAICQELAEKSPVITVVHTENQGCTPARGVGAMKAKGTWVLFVDADDTLPETALQTLMEGAREHRSDIVVGFPFETGYPAYFIAIRDWRARMVKGDPVLCLPTARLFKRELLTERIFQCKFPKGAGTDMVMNAKIAFVSTNDVYILNKKVYNYTIRQDSLSHGTKWTMEKIRRLYEDVVLSIPAQEMAAMKPALIENRLKALEMRLRTSADKTPIRGTSYLQSLKDDIEECQYALSTIQKWIVYRPDTFWTAFLVKAHYRKTVAKEFLQRKFR